MSRSVLQVLPAMHSGGVEQGTLEISSAILERGWNSHVISSGGSLIRTLEAQGATHVSMSVHSKNPLKIWRNGTLLARYIVEHHIDLVHVRSRAPAWSCLRASRLSRIPLVTTFHGQYGHGSKLKRLYNSSMIRGQSVIAVSDFIAQHIQTHYDMDASAITTIYRGIDPERFNPQAVSTERVATLRRNWNLSEDAPLIIMLPGRLTRLKGHQVLIDALQKLKQASPDLHFLALFVGSSIGREAYLAELQQQIEQRKLASQIRFVDSCSDMPAAYSIADIVVSASTKPESFGRTTCEAQAMGKRVVASAHGGTQETLCSAQSQGLFKPNDAQSMAHALIKQAKQSPEQLEQLATLSRQHILEKYQLQAMKQATLGLYESLFLP